MCVSVYVRCARARARVYIFVCVCGFFPTVTATAATERELAGLLYDHTVCASSVPATCNTTGASLFRRACALLNNDVTPERGTRERVFILYYPFARRRPFAIISYRICRGVLRPPATSPLLHTTPPPTVLTTPVFSYRRIETRCEKNINGFRSTYAVLLL